MLDYSRKIIYCLTLGALSISLHGCMLDPGTWVLAAANAATPDEAANAATLDEAANAATLDEPAPVINQSSYLEVFAKHDCNVLTKLDRGYTDLLAKPTRTIDIAQLQLMLQAIHQLRTSRPCPADAI